jgi:hypothetical protein
MNEKYVYIICNSIIPWPLGLPPEHENILISNCPLGITLLKETKQKSSEPFEA